MKCSAKAIANYFLQLHLRRISHLKLQKLVYFAHGLHLGIFDKPLVTNEFAQAWKHGPVFPSLYYEFKEFGKSPIDRLATERAEDGRPLYYPVIAENDVLKKELLSLVWETYGHLDAIALRDLTHEEGTPWSKTFNENPGVCNAQIENTVIRDYFKEQIEDSRRQS